MKKRSTYCWYKAMTALLVLTSWSFNLHAQSQSRGGIIEAIQQGNESRKEWMLTIFREAVAQHERNAAFQFWTHENHAEHIYSDKFISQKLEYIHNNPVKSGIVRDAEDYVHSSAGSYAGEEGMLHVEVLALRWKTV